MKIGKCFGSSFLIPYINRVGVQYICSKYSFIVYKNCVKLTINCVLTDKQLE